MHETDMTTAMRDVRPQRARSHDSIAGAGAFVTIVKLNDAWMIALLAQALEANACAAPLIPRYGIA